jgi:hypothetical protein
MMNTHGRRGLGICWHLMGRLYAGQGYHAGVSCSSVSDWRGSGLWFLRVCNRLDKAALSILAVFGVTEGLIPPDLYASIVFAILLSSIISPLLLRTVLAISPYKEDGAATELQEADESIGESAGGKPTIREDATMKA